MNCLKVRAARLRQSVADTEIQNKLNREEPGADSGV
jgi:hypothetical protein